MIFNTSNIDICKLDNNFQNKDEDLFNYNTRFDYLIFINNIGFLIYNIYLRFFKYPLILLLIIFGELIYIILLWILAYYLCLRYVPIIKSIINYD
jgi:hypothetical protein